MRTTDLPEPAPRERLSKFSGDEIAELLDIPARAPRPKSDAKTPSTSPAPAKKPAILLKSLGALMSEPIVAVDWTWGGRLVAGSVSILAAKPKAGKSTLARNLALAVARGESFLGWSAKPGAVLYLALEERSADVAGDFRSMGADGSENIMVADAGTGIEVVELIKSARPVLLVVDPLFRLVNIKDEKAYAETYTALGPLIDAARDTGTHILCLHHSSKLAKTEAIDSPLGSTALGGAVSTLLVLRRSEKFRSLETVQRVGQDLPETILEFELETKRLSLGGSREGREILDVASEILACLNGKSLIEPEINDVCEGRTSLKRQAIRDLVGRGKVIRSGSGRRGDPYTYAKACSLVPDPIEKNGNKKPTEDSPEDQEKLVPNIHRCSGNKKTRNGNEPESGINGGQKLVPGETAPDPHSEEGGNKLSGEVRI